MLTKFLTTLLLAGLLAWVAIRGWQAAVPIRPVHSETIPVSQTVEAATPRPSLSGTSADVSSRIEELQRRNEALEKDLAAARSELEARKAEVSFSYGTLRESGRFVGLAFRKMFEAAAAEPETAKALRAENQLNLLSLGPFIREAERIESDPDAFAQFQGSLIGEVLGLDDRREDEAEILLAAFKAESLKFEMASSVWVALDRAARERIVALLSPEEQAAVQDRLRLFEDYGVLIVPAYSILGRIEL